ncbi:uncharacterized protein LOC115739185 [Rhodamnia argentea]|uniref:peptidylprolyl isomerase n=1 Tax=Rhodamnia argentea TaxID=178133 RepID=A0A8B8NZQ0_9MYRT|nr:uncharacterized protein LOC115739185 [Rhodamnia argentea]XP_048127578.1 uncharacterized protein LOC115739185 [Rhodamnia argentea]XP_048127579.1 uncharacterized protein LOC115739185 [Rhodamnia argentea]XP_048127580.1 uncharacterized protein LOC115739185 [Rhodamnia argentea]
MASMTMTSSPLNSGVPIGISRDFILALDNPRNIKCCYGQSKNHRQSTSLSVRGLRYLSKPICASGSGLEAVITDPKDNAVTLKNAKIVVESQKENQMQLRVDLTANETQRVFDQVLTNLARTAPPIPGFRRQKGGKTSKVPRDFLLQMLGEDRVTKFVIQEIVTSTMADYVKRENLSVKENKISTTQTAEELKSAFAPGKDFGFNTIVELESPEIETSSSTSDDL